MEDFVMYFQMGWQHIIAWDGYDHILFIMALCAIYMLQDWRKVLVLVTAFTIGHSVTLALSVTNVIQFPTRLIEFLIPVTIFITALFNVLRKQAQPQKIQLNYIFALFFGLIHGLGFSSYLKSMLGTQTNIIQPLLAFNLGLEFGQLLVVVGILLITGIIVNLSGVKRREWNIFLSAAIFGIAVLLSIERFRDLLDK
jgi:hypothetical protein